MSVAVKTVVKQPETFSFTASNFEKAQKTIAKYPPGRQASAVLPLLDMAQRQSGNWLPKAAMDYIASILGMSPIRVYEVATFYTMFNLAPVGQHFIQVCTTTPCWLRGSDEVMSACKNSLGIGRGETTADGKFTVVEVECLGACVNAPMAQINDDYFAKTEQLLQQLKEGKTIKKGPQNGRQCSAPLGERTSLKTAGGTE
jgi:NADH-quinone oxidoreductase E subunit